MPGAPQLITQTIPLTEVLIGVVSNVENPDGAISAQEPPTIGPTYRTGYQVFFDSQFGRFNASGAGSSVLYELLSITSVEWQFHRLPDDNEGACGVHIPGVRTADLTASTLSWSTSGGAVSHEYLWDQGGGGADVYTRTVGYATRGEVSGIDLDGRAKVGKMQPDAPQFGEGLFDRPVVMSITLAAGELVAD